jgi:hypothetical protein
MLQTPLVLALQAGLETAALLSTKMAQALLVIPPLVPEGALLENIR